MSATATGVPDFTDEFAVEDAPAPGEEAEPARETDPRRLEQRQKQIDYGKNTLGYQRYTEEVPRERRRKGHPRTPDVHQSCSKRSFDGQVKKWRRQLHEWDEAGGEQEVGARSPRHEEQTAPKNARAACPAGGLPLKISPAVTMRPGGKRSYVQTLGGAPQRPASASLAAIAALVSPPPRPSEAKQARKQQAGAAPALNLTAAWTAMGAGGSPSSAGAEEEEEVCYLGDDEVAAMVIEVA